jgi:uncharacterized protein
MLVLAAVSVAVGFAGSLTGLGGASILIPLLTLSGVPVKEAIASSMVAIIATSSGSASTFVRERLTNVKLAMFLEVFTIVGAIAGATITTIINPVFLYFFFALFLSTSFLRMRRRSNQFPSQPDRFSEWLQLKGSYYDEARHEQVTYQVARPLLGGLGMLFAGLAAGMLGTGAGAFKTTVQENIMRIPSKAATTTSNFIMGMTALAGVSVYLFSGLLNLSLMAPMAVGTTIGSMFGGRLLNRIQNRYLTILFFIIVSYIIVQMIYQGVRAL